MHLIFPVRLAVREADIARALDILDAPFIENDDMVPMDDFPAPPR